MSVSELHERADDVAEVLLAMANAKRLMVMCHLLEQELSVGELLERVDLGQSAMSQHLARLRAMKLVATRRSAQQVYYRLASPEVSRLLATIKEIWCGDLDTSAATC